MYYDGIGNEIGTEMALLEANRPNVAQSVAEAKERAAQAKLEQQQQQEHASMNVADGEGNLSELKEGDQPSPNGEDGGKLPPILPHPLASVVTSL